MQAIFLLSFILLHLGKLAIERTKKNISSMSFSSVPSTSEWNAHVDNYKNGIARFTSLHATDLVGATLGQIRSAKTILDVGCGTGAFGLAYLNYFPKGIAGQTLIFSDLSDGMIKAAEESMKKRIPDDFQTKLVFQVEDGTKLGGIADGDIDVVVSVFGVFLIPDRAATFAAIRRVLKPNSGVFATAAWTSTKETGLQTNDYGANLQDTVIFALNGLNEKPAESNEDTPVWMDWIDPKNLTSMLEQEGEFSDIRVHRVAHSIPFENVNTVWSTLVDSNPFATTAGKDPALVEKVKKAFFEFVGAQDPSLPVFLHAASNLVVANWSLKKAKE